MNYSNQILVAIVFVYTYRYNCTSSAKKQSSIRIQSYTNNCTVCVYIIMYSVYVYTQPADVRTIS